MAPLARVKFAEGSIFTLCQAIFKSWGSLVYVPSEFSGFVEVCELVRQTSSKNAKVAAIAVYLKEIDDASLQPAVLFLSGTATWARWHSMQSHVKDKSGTKE
jgi:hypothetical protein